MRYLTSLPLSTASVWLSKSGGEIPVMLSTRTCHLGNSCSRWRISRFWRRSATVNSAKIRKHFLHLLGEERENFMNNRSKKTGKMKPQSDRARARIEREQKGDRQRKRERCKRFVRTMFQWFVPGVSKFFVVYDVFSIWEVQDVVASGHWLNCEPFNNVSLSVHLYFFYASQKVPHRAFLCSMLYGIQSFWGTEKRTSNKKQTTTTTKLLPVKKTDWREERFQLFRQNRSMCPGHTKLKLNKRNSYFVCYLIGLVANDIASSAANASKELSDFERGRTQCGSSATCLRILPQLADLSESSCKYKGVYQRHSDMDSALGGGGGQHNANTIPQGRFTFRGRK